MDSSSATKKSVIIATSSTGLTTEIHLPKEIIYYFLALTYRPHFIIGQNTDNISNVQLSDIANISCLPTMKPSIMCKFHFQ